MTKSNLVFDSIATLNFEVSNRDISDTIFYLKRVFFTHPFAHWQKLFIYEPGSKTLQELQVWPILRVEKIRQTMI